MLSYFVQRDMWPTVKVSLRYLGTFHFRSISDDISVVGEYGDHTELRMTLRSGVFLQLESLIVGFTMMPIYRTSDNMYSSDTPDVAYSRQLH